MFGISWVQWLGYLASLLILVSMMMNSILKLRIINVVGSTLFAIYGLIIHAIPVLIVNGTIAIINFYFLIRFFTSKSEIFKVLKIRGHNFYLREFLKFYKQDIEKYFPKFKYEPEKNRYSFFILRNMNVAGIFMARIFQPETLLITLDYAIPAYRDFKVGKFIYNHYAHKFIKDGFNTLIAHPSPSRKHNRYLHKMGFKRTKINGHEFFVKHLTNNTTK